MRIRIPFAVAFIILLLISSSLGLLPHSTLPSSPIPTPRHSDKAAHFLSFFFLTATFYFILDTSRRRVLHLTLLVCTLCLGVGSEVLQGLLPNGRDFDPWDVLANVLGSLLALGLAGWYHKRSAERRRRAKYSTITGESPDDLELGENPGLSGVNGSAVEGQESGVVSTLQPQRQQPHRSVEEELDNWDENAEDDAWDDGDEIVPGQPVKSTQVSASGEDAPSKKVAVD